MSNSSPEGFGQCLYSLKAGAPKTIFVVYFIQNALLLQTSDGKTVNSLCSESCEVARAVGGNAQSGF